MSTADANAVVPAPNSDSSTERFHRFFVISAYFALSVGLVFSTYLVIGTPPLLLVPTVSSTGVSIGFVLLVTIIALAGVLRPGLKIWPWKISKEMLSTHIGRLLKSIKSRIISREEMLKEMKAIMVVVQSTEKLLRDELQQLSKSVKITTQLINNELLQVKAELQQKTRLCTELQHDLKLMRQETNEVKAKEEIKSMIGIVQSIGNHLKRLDSHEINKDEVKEEINVAMQGFLSLKEHLIQIMKSEKINKEEEEQIQDAMQSAMQAVQSMDAIIN